MRTSKPVVVGTDGSEQAQKAVAWAADEAAARGLSLRIVHSVDGQGRMARGLEDVLSEAGQGLLEEAEREARERQPSIEVETRVLRGAMSHALREMATESFEIVLGHRGRGGFRGLLLGSTARRVAGRVAGPVVIVRGRVEARYGEIVAGIDPFEDEHDPGALEYAFEAAVVRKARIRAIHAFQIADTLLPLTPTISTEEVAGLARQELEKAVAPWREKFPQVEVTEQVVQAHPVEVLVNASESADLLVMGAHGHSALGGWLVGSTTHGAFEHAHCPIVAVRPRA